jgi:phosphoribosylaminoimidazole-succinocarboxamide synthase
MQVLWNLQGSKPYLYPIYKGLIRAMTRISPFEEMINLVGRPLAEKLRQTSIRIYEKALDMAEQRGIIIADTKFEFGLLDGRTIVIDEMLTPDSSRFWSKKAYKPGMAQDSYDKQIVRDYLEGLDWPKTYPGPELPPSVVEKTRSRYIEIYEILTGKRFG